MELFREKNGKYYADSLSQAGGKTSLRLVILFVGIAGFAGSLAGSPGVPAAVVTLISFGIFAWIGFIAVWGYMLIALIGILYLANEIRGGNA